MLLIKLLSVSVQCTMLLEHVIILSISCFDIDFASQIKLAELPLSHWLELEFFNIHRTPTKLQEGNVFSHVCVYSQGAHM